MRRVEKVLLVLGGIAIGACATEAVSTAVHTAHAQAARRCDYTSLIDAGTPELDRLARSRTTVTGRRWSPEAGG